MTGAHTPGPWSRGPSYLGDGTCINGAGIYAGDFLVVRMPVKADRPLPQKEADARLIAAAPALLEALRAFANLTVNGEDHAAFATKYPALAAHVERARAAIALARGGE